MDYPGAAEEPRWKYSHKVFEIPFDKDTIERLSKT